jgi:hypothetical protein
MVFLQEQEAICVELGKKDGLSASYGNQASILREQGRLDEALALQKEEEAICLELGDKSGLAYCYWAWGLLERVLGNFGNQRAKLLSALDLFQALGMLRERDQVKAALVKASFPETS